MGSPPQPGCTPPDPASKEAKFLAVKDKLEHGQPIGTDPDPIKAADELRMGYAITSAYMSVSGKLAELSEDAKLVQRAMPTLPKQNGDIEQLEKLAKEIRDKQKAAELDKGKPGAEKPLTGGQDATGLPGKPPLEKTKIATPEGKRADAAHPRAGRDAKLVPPERQGRHGVDPRVLARIHSQVSHDHSGGEQHEALVRAEQHYLNQHGAHLKEDGIEGHATKSALDHGLHHKHHQHHAKHKTFDKATP